MSDIGKQKLSKDELTALLKMRDTSAPEEGKKSDDSTRRISKYDFTQPSRFNKSELESLRKINESLAQSAGGRIARLIEAGLKARLINMDQMKWKDMVGDTEDFGPGFVFRMEPQGHNCAFVIGRRLALICVDRLTGGQGASKDEMENDEEENVVLTPLEQKLLAKVANCFISRLPGVWKGVGEFKTSLGAYVDDFSDYDLMSPDEDVFQVSFLIQGTIGTGQISLVTPFQAVQTLPVKLQQPDRKVALSDEDVVKSLRESINKTAVTLSVVLGRTELKVHQLLEMETGDVMLFDRRVDQKMDVLFNNNPKLKGFIGVSSGKYAVRIEGVNNNQET